MFNPQSPAGHDLRTFIKRLQAKDAESAAISRDKAEIYEEVRQAGFIPKAVKAIVAMLRKDPAKGLEDAAILTAYLQALGIDKDHIKAQGDDPSASIRGRDDFPSQMPDGGFAVI